MRTLTLNELDSVSGGASGRDIAMAIGTLSGQFVAGGIGAAAGLSLIHISEPTRPY